MIRLLRYPVREKNELQDKYVSKQLERIFKEREAVHASAGEKKYVAVIDERIQEYEDEIIHPILCGGDVIGAVILLRKEEKIWRDRRKTRRMRS